MNTYPPRYYPPVRMPSTWAPSYRLYSPAMVLLAAFLGFPFAGFLLIGANYWALGRKGAAWATWILGAFGTLGWMVLLYLLVPYLPGSIPYAAGVFGTYGLAHLLQGELYKQHRNAGGLPGSGWKVAGSVAVTMSLFFAFLQFTKWLVRVTEPPALVKVTVGNVTVDGDEGVTEAEARAAAEALMTVPWYAKNRRHCGMERNYAGHAVSIITKEGYWDRPKSIDLTRELARALTSRAPQLGPWQVRLRDKDFNIRRTVTP